MVKTWSKIVFGSISLSLLIAGCSGSEDFGKTIVQSDDDAVETFSDLPKCTNKSADRIVTVTKEEADYICNASSREWVEIVTKFRDLPSCTNKREGDVFYVLKDEDYYYEVLYAKVYDFVYENAVAVDATETDATEDDASSSDGLVDDYGTTEEE